jgi:hypothetical protein
MATIEPHAIHAASFDALQAFQVSSLRFKVVYGKSTLNREP